VSAATRTQDLAEEVDAILAGTNLDPHRLLGPHSADGGTVVRAFAPEASSLEVAHPGAVVPMRRVLEKGLWEAVVATPGLQAYRLRFASGPHRWEAEDPYRFPPTIGELDLHLIAEGSHRQLWRRLGARVMEHDGVPGTAFAVWAPNARGVHLVCDANQWDARTLPMRALGGSGVWELFLPAAGAGTRYKFQITRPDLHQMLKADPLAKACERPPATASVVAESAHQWKDSVWMKQRSQRHSPQEAMAVYEVHLGSWRRGPDNAVLGYRQIAPLLAEHCRRFGFTHVELMPVMEHPYGGSWGYQVTGYYAPTARYGSPDDFRWFVDHLHQNGVGVILDWVPAHFPRDAWALARFDGTPLYEDADPRRGAHPDWGTLVFNYARNEVRNFLVANARYWVEEFHVDGLRVDAVASMLYLDYSRRPGEWIPNIHGGKENLDAIALLREVNDSLRQEFPGSLTIAEESTAWPGVTRPTASGGLGFSFKWNMGWMHDTLDYLKQDPVYRRYHHHRLTFGLWYAWAENFILPLSHDEVVHMKGSLLRKMSGDRWQRFANLRSLFAWMWAHPGKKLLFMGGEFAQEAEWSDDASLDWEELEQPEHAGVQQLMSDLGARFGEIPALHELDDSPDGFQWIDAGNADQNVIGFVRFDSNRHPGIACIANFSPVVRHGFRLGLPLPGTWDELINTDSPYYGGSGQGNLGAVHAEPVAWHAWGQSAVLTLPPLGVLWLAPRRADGREATREPGLALEAQAAPQ
jgi:1,4-alpha-glucan branching enzyme